MSAVAQILRPNDSQGIALGLTGVSYREGLFSTYSNPAGLKLNNFRFSFSHIPATKTFGSVGVNQEAFAIGVSISNLGNEIKHNDFTLDKPFQLLRLGLAAGKMANSDSSLGLMGTIEYQKSLNDDELHAEWNHLGIGLELQFARYLFGRLGYNLDLSDVDKDDKIRGLTYGLGFNTPAKIKLIVPVDLSLNYGRGITDYRGLDSNVVSVDVGFDL
jgi:hypothetical protein